MKRPSYLHINITIILLVALALPLLLVMGASDYDRVFKQEPLKENSFIALSPYKSIEGFEYWPLITSKNNQARYVSGTNPHRGTDLSVQVGELIYPIYDGEIVFLNQDISSQTGQIIVKSYVGNDQYVYIEYLHIAPLEGLNLGSKVYTSIPIARIDTNKKYDCHLHIGRVDEANKLHFQFYDLFGNVPAWNMGSDMDVFSNPQFNNQTNDFSITAYVSSDTDNTDYYGGYGRFPLEYIEVYYSINYGSWQKTIISNHTNFTYTFNFKEITKGKSGDKIRYYITAIRDNDSDADTTFKGAPYRISYYPAYFAHPAYSLTYEQAGLIALELTLN